jgi:hypothetical protein
MRQIRTSGLMSGEGKRSHWPCLTATAPFLDSTIPKPPILWGHGFGISHIGHKYMVASSGLPGWSNYLDRRPMFVLCSDNRVGRGAPISADERPLAPRKGEPKDRLKTGSRCRRRTNEGLAPVR